MPTPADDRAAMVERLRDHGIDDPRVLAAMGEVPRERFVHPRYADQAYDEKPLPIGLGQTISAPWIVAFSVVSLGQGPDADVLEIGTGSGYAAAVLARCFRSVVTIERHPEFADRAATAIAATGTTNVQLRTGDGTLGAPDRAPFDGIVVAAMADGEPPPALLQQLSADGTLVCPVGDGRRGVLRRYRGGRTEKLAVVAFVPLVSDGDPTRAAPT